MNYELLRDAHVSVRATRNEKNFPVAVATINGTHEHRFDATSRVSKSLDLMTPDDLAERLSGGQYFMVDDQLVDFRDGHYNGFIHTDQSIDKLVETLGINPAAELSTKVHNNLISGDFVLGNKWSDHGITVPGYHDGGEFRSELHFGWNPFVQTVNSAFMLWRLICTNGMRGLTSFLNTKIPLINRWEEHLEIANRQIQNRVEGMVSNRLSSMGTERATVAETLLVAQHAQTRLNKDQVRDESVRRRLRNIADIAHPMAHLGGVYKSNVFADKRLAAQMPAHLTTFDVYNMATELRTHTHASDGSSDHALDKFANSIVFDRKDLTQHASRYSLPQQSSFSDPDAAFFGEMH